MIFMIDLIDFNRLKDFFSLKNHTHSYTNLEDKPTIPTKTSDLQNDSGFLTNHQSLSNYYTKTEIDALIGDAIEVINGSGGE